MNKDDFDDAKYFGTDVWVYCNQHLRPHRTGWCTVNNRNKTLLEAKTDAEAYAECKQRKFHIFRSEDAYRR